MNTKPGCPACKSPRYYGTPMHLPLRMYWRGDFDGRRVWTTVFKSWVDWRCSKCGHSEREDKPDEEATW